MRYWLYGVVALFLAACSAAGGDNVKPPVPDLSDVGPAPELANRVWLNIDHPLRLADLRGKVVLIDMWTFA